VLNLFAIEFNVDPVTETAAAIRTAANLSSTVSYLTWPKLTKWLNTRHNSQLVGNSYLGITSGLLVIRPESAEFWSACGRLSFVPQRHHWIDAHCPPGGKKAGRKCHGGNKEHDDREGEWIVRADIKQKTTDETARKN
jgi:hypothetical protein